MGNPIIHFEVAGTDGPSLETFYSQLFGWKIDHQGQGDMQYGFVQEGSAGPIGGGIRHEPGGKPEVVFYVQVEDLQTAIRSALDLGGKVRIEPVETGDVTFAMITDPQGNSLGIIQLPEQDDA
ncbi:MAG: VOC family protein [Bacteroidetes bacterium]|nr:VOC family protein [Bacteroidota bacterium]